LESEESTGEMAYLIKQDSTGNFLWGKAFTPPAGGEGTSRARRMEIDDSGNIYTAGIFFGTIDMKLGQDTTNLVGTWESIFISKYTSEGNLIWTKVLPGNGITRVLDLKIGPKKEVWIAGDFTYSLGNAMTNGESDAFVARISANGQLMNMKTFGGAKNDYVVSLEIDDNGNALAVGTFQDSLSTGPVHLISSGGETEIFMFKLDSLIQPTWGKK
jgi:hypothetical protein